MPRKLPEPSAKVSRRVNSSAPATRGAGPLDTMAVAAAFVRVGECGVQHRRGVDDQPTATTPTARRRRCTRIATAGFAVTAAMTLVTTTFAAVLGPAAAPASADNWAAANPNDFPDPSVVHVNGEYYGFATQGSARNAGFVNVQVATSSDGVHWATSPMSTRSRAPEVGQPRQHLGPERRPNTAPTSGPGDVLRGHRGEHGRPVHRHGDGAGERPDRPLHRRLGFPGRLPEQHGPGARHRGQRGLRREHRPRRVHRLQRELVVVVEE